MKSFVLFFLPFCFLAINNDSAFSQVKQKPTLNHIAVYVHDLQKSTNFYQNIIGLELMDEPFKDGRHTWFDMGVQGQFHLISGADKELEQIKNRHICFSVASVEEFIKNLLKHNIRDKNKLTNISL